MSVGTFSSGDKIDPNDPRRNNELKSSNSELENLFKGACPNCLQISKKYFPVPLGILKSKIRSWSLI